MKNKQTIKWILIIAGAILLILVIAAAVILALKKTVENRRVLNSPPTVLVQSPDPGEEFPEGFLLTTTATVTGRNSISNGCGGS